MTNWIRPFQTNYEKGLEVQQEIEIIDGEIVKDEEITYDDYKWDCPCPMI